MRILYLDLDTLRPDHLGCYGYSRDTSPNIDRGAREGVRFEGCYCSDAPCLPSRAALTSGRFGIHTGVVNHGGICADRLPDGPKRGFRDSFSCGGSFANVLRDVGLHTCYIGGFGERHSACWYYAGFHEIHDTAGYGMESAEGVTPRVLDWIARNGTELGRDELIVSQCCHVCQRAVRWDTYLYIRTWHVGESMIHTVMFGNGW